AAEPDANLQHLLVARGIKAHHGVEPGTVHAIALPPRLAIERQGPELEVLGHHVGAARVLVPLLLDFTFVVIKDAGRHPRVRWAHARLCTVREHTTPFLTPSER